MTTAHWMAMVSDMDHRYNGSVYGTIVDRREPLWVRLFLASLVGVLTQFQVLGLMLVARDLGFASFPRSAWEWVSHWYLWVWSSAGIVTVDLAFSRYWHPIGPNDVMLRALANFAVTIVVSLPTVLLFWVAP